jgi:hypothetical protein
MTAVNAPCRRASASTATMSGLAPLEPRGAPVHRDETRRRQRDEHAVARAQRVLRVACGVVAGAARRDDDVGDGALLQRACEVRDGGALPGEQAPDDDGLFVNLVPEVCVVQRASHVIFQ